MIVDYLVAVTLVLAVLGGWIAVQQGSRRFAARHPEYGPHRECVGCALSCVCEPASTDRKTTSTRKQQATPQSGGATGNRR